MSKFKIEAKIVLTAEKIIEADSEEDAMEMALAINVDEWTDYVVAEHIEDLEVMPCRKR